MKLLETRYPPDLNGKKPALCRAAIKATTNARFPKPPSQVVYGDFKNAVLEFRPQ
ncbi:cell envelope integrity TolA C-terminal domain-containing protein [Serratia proteamaculans]|jgi:colicin import membrane protein|uniref:cell envelope integrity TolA C-terminal domain-containing protein n=1 Tax=Serratia proteamaculans TaxID=28151 RepID=UPI0036F2B804